MKHELASGVGIPSPPSGALVVVIGSRVTSKYVAAQHAVVQLNACLAYRLAFGTGKGGRTAAAVVVDRDDHVEVARE